MKITSTQELSLENDFVNALPGDSESANFRRQVGNACYSLVKPKVVPQPELIAYSKSLAEELGFTKEFCESQTFADNFSGNLALNNSQPYAMCYGGHQFGNWAGQLGDGRAINLGEVRDKNNCIQTLQLKGAGPTPYSRSADGLAVLRSSIREFLCSEAMHSLGVPTTRALSVIGTGEQVLRDMFYDGHPEYEPGAVVCRVAPSFIRFGNFEIHAARQEHELLKQLADYTIGRFFPELNLSDEDVYLKWLTTVAEKTAAMIVDWMRVGFVHGVMNTDNMSIHGITIDYGPYGWLDNFDPDWTPNTTDAQGRRYRYANQPGIAQWNLLQLANAIYPLVKDAKALQAVVENFAKIYQSQWQDMMAAKLGLQKFGIGDDQLITALLDNLQAAEIDMTIFYRLLADFKTEPEQVDDLQHFKDCYYQFESASDQSKEQMRQWLRAYRNRVNGRGQPAAERAQRMKRVNPKYVLRNYLAQQAIDKAHEKDYSLVNTLLVVMQHPYDEQPEYQEFFAKRPDWARQRPGCSMLSCSS